jgi:hypothetical protein
MKIILSAILITLLISCKRDNNPVNGQVRIRVENGTTNAFTNTRVGVLDYGLVAAGSQTSYQLMPVPVYAAGCTFEINNQSAYAGDLICGSPLPPPFSQGNYTYKITEQQFSGQTIYTLVVEKN